MPAPLDADKRAAILDDIRADELSCRAIAKKHGVSASTVSKIAAEDGEEPAFERAQTQKATRAREADNAYSAADLAARRLALAAKLHDTAVRLLEQVEEPQTYFDWGGSTHSFDTHEAPEPIPSDKRALLGAASVAIDKSLKLAPPEQDQQGLAAVDAWLRGMMGGDDGG